MGNNPQTLKFTQNSSDWVLQTNSFKTANPKKKYIHLLFKSSQPSVVNETDFPINFFNTGSFVKYLPKIKAKANKIFMIVGLIKINTGLLK